MIGRFEEHDGNIYGDTKNQNAIARYLKYFDQIHVVARRVKHTGLYKRHLITFDCSENVKFSLYNELSGFWNILAYRKEFIDILRTSVESSDCVLCWAETKIPLIAHVCRLYGKKLIVYVGGSSKDILLASRSIPRKLAGLWLYFIHRRFIRTADYVHYVTLSALQDIYPTHGKNIGASYVKIIPASEAVLNGRITRKRDNDKVVLGIIGYLNEVKGLDTAIRALSLLRNEYSLRVLGGGDQSAYSKLASQLGVRERVFFDGTVEPGTAVMVWLDQIDIYLQPSRSEGLPRSTIEAMGRGCPVISTSAVGLAELVDQKLRHKNGDWKRLAFLITQLSGDQDEMRQQAERNFNTAKKYSREIQDGIIDQFFADILRDLEDQKITS